MSSGQAPRYVVVKENGSMRPPEPRRNKAPRNETSDGTTSGKCCLKCICCCYCFLLILILLVLGFTIYLVKLYQPRTPSYTITNVAVESFDIHNNNVLHTQLSISVKADNPNRYISFTYDNGSSVDVLYSQNRICSGKLPAFHQPPNNISIFNIHLSGYRRIGPSYHQSLQRHQRSNTIPLLVMVKAPVNLFIGPYHSKRVVFLLNCSIVVNSLAPEKGTKILSTEYLYDMAI